MDLTEEEEQSLIADVATRAGTTNQLCKWYGVTVSELKAWVAAHRDELEAYSETPERQPQRTTEPDPMELSDLWLTNKFERLKRLQIIADAIMEVIDTGGVDQALVREYRSLLALAANELGQLLHRGSGEGTENTLLEVDMVGIDMESLK
jgi:transposase-like protein